MNITNCYWKNVKGVWWSLKKWTITIWSSSSLLGVYSESSDSERYLYTRVHSSVVHISQKAETIQTHASVNRRRNNMWYRHTMKYYSALKRKEILAHAVTRINLEDRKLREISQTRKDKYCIYDSTYFFNFFFFFFGSGVCRILVPWPGIKPVPPAAEAWSLNHWTAREVPCMIPLNMRSLEQSNS